MWPTMKLIQPYTQECDKFMWWYNLLLQNISKYQWDTPCFFPRPSFPLQYMYATDEISSVYGRRGTKLSPTLAAFVNGVAVSINRLNRWVTIVQAQWTVSEQECFVQKISTIHISVKMICLILANSNLLPPVTVTFFSTDSLYGLWWYMAPCHSSFRSSPSSFVSTQWHDAC